MPTATETHTKRFVTFDQLLEALGCFSAGQVRWLLSHREENGLNQYVHKVGKRIYIDLQGFISWLNRHDDKGGKL